MVHGFNNSDLEKPTIMSKKLKDTQIALGDQIEYYEEHPNFHGYGGSG